MLMLRKIKKIWLQHGVVICVVCCLIGIVGYFVNIIVFQNHKDVVNVLVLSPEVDVKEMENDLKRVVEVGNNEEIAIKYLDINNEANQAIVLTWLRAKTVDVIISDEEKIGFFAENACLLELDGLLDPASGEKGTYYYNGIVSYDSEGKIIGKEEDKVYGVHTEKINGIEGMSDPVAAIVANVQNKSNAVRILNHYINEL